ncbi:MAG: FxLYD domain-containing protein [Bacteroidota bacterium]
MLRLLSLVALVALAGCSEQVLQANVHDLKLQRRGSAYPTLTGYVVNQSDAPITSADVSVTLYDADNRPLEDVMVQVRSIPAGDTARFEHRLDVEAGGAKLKYLSAN